MPRKVDKVPDPWEPFKDGSIWEFTLDEWREMPMNRPMSNEIGEITGMTSVTWYIVEPGQSEGKQYVRFLTDEQRRTMTVAEMAGW